MKLNSKYYGTHSQLEVPHNFTCVSKTQLTVTKKSSQLTIVHCDWETELYD